VLAEAGRIETDYAVPCQVLACTADLAEISLAENSVREAMHPADEFEAFRALVEEARAKPMSRRGSASPKPVSAAA
jgi:ParB family chromosome partitioning protein